MNLSYTTYLLVILCTKLKIFLIFIENCGKTIDFDPFQQKEVKTPQVQECSSFRALQDEFCEIEKICERSVGFIFESKFEKFVGEPIFKLSVSVGFIIPKGLGGKSIPFTLCEIENGRCLLRNGKLALFGGNNNVESTDPLTSEFYNVRTSFVYSEDVDGEDDTFKWESLQLTNFEDSLPSQAPPFVIVKITNGKQELSYAELQPGIDKTAYGDLLDSFGQVVPFGTYQKDKK